MQSGSLTNPSYYFCCAHGVCPGASEARSSPGPKVELKKHRPSSTHSCSASYDPGLEGPQDPAGEASPAPSFQPRPGGGGTPDHRLQLPRADQICAVRLGGFRRRNPQALRQAFTQTAEPTNKGPVGEGWPASLELLSPRALPSAPDLLGEKSGHSGESYPQLPQCTNSHYSRLNAH